MKKYIPTENEIEIIKHSLGLNRRAKPYRNYFCTGEGSTDFDACENLVNQKLMTRHKKEFITDYIYCVTEEGKRSID